jgi:membrane protease YdiL (CAAX protease family)
LVVYIVLIDFIIYSTTSPYHLYDYELGGTLEGGITKSLTALLTYGLIIGTATIFIFLDEYLGKGKEIKPKSKKSTVWFRLIMLGILTFISLPWIFALNGIYISDIPGFNLLFLAREPGIGPYISEKEKIFPAVHLGEHHGLSGFMLILFSIGRVLISYREP